jgi:hypothetical protein
LCRVIDVAGCWHSLLVTSWLIISKWTENLKSLAACFCNLNQRLKGDATLIIIADVYFFVTITYAILRHNGVELGMMNF